MAYPTVEQNRAYNRKYYQDHKAERQRYRRDYHAANKEREKDAELRRLYNIDIHDFKAILTFQGNRCALFEVCGHTEPGGHGTWHVDHDHETGGVRGLLCHDCNRMRVGINTLESARAVVRYLERSPFQGACTPRCRLGR